MSNLEELALQLQLLQEIPGLAVPGQNLSNDRKSPLTTVGQYYVKILKTLAD